MHVEASSLQHDVIFCPVLAASMDMSSLGLRQLVITSACMSRQVQTRISMTSYSVTILAAGMDMSSLGLRQLVILFSESSNSY